MKKFFFTSNLLLLLSISICNAQQTVGLFTQNSGSLDGYVLFAPIPSLNTYLIDKCGYLIHTWTSPYRPGQAVYFLPDGNLLRAGNVNNAVFTAGGNGGIIEKFDWNSNLIWSYTISSTTECQHHDIKPMPNGNILVISWELKTIAEATAAGRNPATLGNSLWSEKIIELQPVGANSANIVWEWHAWDHLVQEYDNSKANFDSVSHHPELLNLNYVSGNPTNPDWLHLNAIDYNPALDQIMISSHSLCEIWIIDHSTTTAEAATHAGGTHNKGGDFLYRWGNAAVYNHGTVADKNFFGQHSVHWIEPGLKDAGNIMVFNNGLGRPAGSFSTVEIFSTPLDSSGDYTLNGSLPYQPDSSYWKYTAPNPTDFFGANISGAYRLSNGNTIICTGPKGDFFEIDSLKNTVWRYVNPVSQSGIITQGNPATANTVFRCTLYEPSYPGFAGLTLTTGNPIEINPLAYTCSMLATMNEIALNNNSVLQITNPIEDELIIRATENILNAAATLVDVSGRVMEQFENISISQNNSTSLKLNTHLAAGIYFFNLKTSQKNLVVKLMHQ